MRRRKANLPAEQMAREASVLVADPLRDRLNRQLLGLQYLLGLLKPKRMDIFQRRQASGLAKRRMKVRSGSPDTFTIASTGDGSA